MARAKPSDPLKVFIGCPGDMAPERAALLSLRDHLDELGCPVRFLIWKNATPAAGGAQKVIFDNYPIKSWDIFIGLLWTRFGVPSGIVDPLSAETLTGTESEFTGAYDAFVASGGVRPPILLYRCRRPFPDDVDLDQVAGVRRFFARTETGALRPALTQDFKTRVQLTRRVTQDIVKVAAALRNAAKKPTISGTKVTRAAKSAPDWAAAEESYRRHLCEAHRIVKFHTAEARAPVEVELEKVFIKLRTSSLSHSEEDFTVVVNGMPVSGTPDHIWNELTSTLKGEGDKKLELDNVRNGRLERTSYSRAEFRRFAFESRVGMSVHSVADNPTSLPDLLRQQSHLALAGSPGSGKSTLLQYLVLTFASRQQQTRLQLEEERLPVLIRLRQFHRYTERRGHDRRLHEVDAACFHEFLEDVWEHEAGAPELPAGFFKRLLSLPNALILLDGLDEIAQPAERRNLAQLISWNLRDWRQARIILTSRPKAWENEGRPVLGSYVGEARICDLDDAQIEEFVHHWYLAATVAARGDSASARGHAESRAVDLIGAVKPERIRKLAATPLMLSILAMVHSRGVGLPQERSQLYHECIEFMLGYWDEIAGFSPDPELHEVARLERQTKRQLLEPVALWMHRLGSEQIEPLHDDLVKQLTAGFTSVLNEPRDSAQRHARLFLKLIVERGGLMQESEAGQFRFVHLTFQEYLAASAIAHGEAPFAQVEDHLHDPWWREVILLAGGELSRQRSYRVKSDTTAWLGGILGAETWAEKWLLRDLQLAVQSCAEMSETGVDPALTAELAGRLFEELSGMGAELFVADLRDFARQLPASHLTKAIIARLVEEIKRFKRTVKLRRLIGVADLFPSSVMSPALLEVFETTAHSGNELEAWDAAFICILHGPANGRLAALKVMRDVSKSNGRLDSPDLDRLVEVKDSGLHDALVEWLREGVLSKRLSHRTRCAVGLVRHGNTDDQSVGIATLVAEITSGAPWRTFYSLVDLMSLGRFAFTPEVIASLEVILADPTSEDIISAVRAWEAIMENWGKPVDLSLLHAIAAHPTSSAWQTAAGVVLKLGNEEDRLVVRANLEARRNRGELIVRLTAADLVLECDPEVDRAAAAARVEDALDHHLMAESPDALDFRRMKGIARRLGELAWTCPQFIRFFQSRAESKGADSYEALEVLVGLVRIRPKDAKVFTAPVQKLGELAFDIISEANQDSQNPISAVMAVSMLPEFRRSVKRGGGLFEESK